MHNNQHDRRMKAAADTDNCGVCVNERRLCFGGAGGGRRVAAGGSASMRTESLSIGQHMMMGQHSGMERMVILATPGLTVMVARWTAKSSRKSVMRAVQ